MAETNNYKNIKFMKAIVISNHARLIAVCVLFFASMLLGHNSITAQQDTSFALKKNDASAYFREAEMLCRKDKGRLWGISLCGPILLVEPETREVYANKADNEGILKKEGDIFVGVLPPKVNIANTASEWTGVHWMMVQLPLDKNLYARRSKMAHELWHRIQEKIGFLSSVAANNHLDSRYGRIWLQLEFRALRKALLSRRGNERVRAIKDALIFRTYRRSRFSQSGIEENAMEMHEGLADYTGIKLSGHPKLEQYAAEHIESAERSGKTDTFVRSFAYATGPAYGLLLDSANKNWRINLRKNDDFGVLLQKSLALELPQDIKSAAENIINRYNGQALIAAETEREDDREKILAPLRAKLIEGAIVEIPLQKMNMSFNPNNLIPLNPYGTVYPNIRVVDVWGILEVKQGGALINPTFNRIIVPVAIDLNSRPIKGNGWTLELNEGWSLVKGRRDGDYSLKNQNSRN